tara:strand:+ start:2885 stop:3667 length:783 start_codon:yes stop_codon:yes gene_type:complete
MNEKKNKYILDWITKLSEIRPELGNFAVCPYASASKFIILEEELRKVRPRVGWDVVIYAVEDDHDSDFLYAMVDDYNRVYKTHKFIADHRKSKTFINGVQTNNGKYNLVLCQPKEDLTEARKKLAKTKYYDYWDENYLEEVLEDDFDKVFHSMGKHLLLEVYDVDSDTLNDYQFMKDIFFNGIIKSKSKILNTIIHKFTPHGVTILFALAESHVSLHTWPEKGCFTADFYTCGDKDPEIIAKYVIEALKSKKHRIRLLNR